LAEEIRPNDRNQRFLPTSNRKHILSSSFLKDRKTEEKKQHLTQKRIVQSVQFRFLIKWLNWPMSATEKKPNLSELLLPSADYRCRV
jgi:hypothetical protein